MWLSVSAKKCHLWHKVADLANFGTNKNVFRLHILTSNPLLGWKSKIHTRQNISGSTGR